MQIKQIDKKQLKVEPKELHEKIALIKVPSSTTEPLPKKITTEEPQPKILSKVTEVPNKNFEKTGDKEEKQNRLKRLKLEKQRSIKKQQKLKNRLKKQNSLKKEIKKLQKKNKLSQKLSQEALKLYREQEQRELEAKEALDRKTALILLGFGTSAIALATFSYWYFYKRK